MRIADIINGQTISTSIWNQFIHEEAILNAYTINISDFASTKDDMCVTLTRWLSDPVIKFYVDGVRQISVDNVNKLLLIISGRS